MVVAMRVVEVTWGEALTLTSKIMCESLCHATTRRSKRLTVKDCSFLPSFVDVPGRSASVFYVHVLVAHAFFVYV